MSTRLCDEAAPESHERSTKDLKMLNKDFDEKTAEIKEMISRELEVIDLRNDEIIKANNSHPRMPTILSLVNKIQTEKPSNETAPKRCFGVVDLIDDSDDNDDNDLKIIEKPACFNAKSITAEKADIQPPPSSQAVFIDLDEPLSDEEDSGFLYMDSECEIDDDDESVDEEEEEVFVQGEALINQEEGSSKAKTPEREVQSSPAQSSSGSESPCTSEPSSPPDVMSSKSLNSWLGTDHLPIHAPGQGNANHMFSISITN